MVQADFQLINGEQREKRRKEAEGMEGKEFQMFWAKNLEREREREREERGQFVSGGAGITGAGGEYEK